MILKDKGVKKIFLEVAAYSSLYIFLPIIFFGSFGFFTDKYLSSKPKFTLISVGIAFIVSNVLLFRKRKFLAKKMIEKIKITEK